MWLMYAAGSAFFAGITSILAKCGIRKTDSTVATAVRTEVVLIFSWLIAGAAGSVDQVRSVDGKASWLCYYRALQEGPASVVAPVDKLSVLVTAVFSYFVFGETLSRKAGIGLILLTAGTAAMAFIS